MKKLISKRISTVVSICLVLNALTVFPFSGSAADEEVPAGYSVTAPQNVILKTGEYYKELTSFEGTGIRSTDVGTVSSTIKQAVNYSTTNVINGSKNCEWTFTAGGNNDIKTTGFTFDNANGSDWSKAKYIQFYVDNPMGTALQLGNVQLYPNKVAAAIANGVTVDFYNTETSQWTTLTTKPSANPAYTGIEIPKNTKGYVRIPINTTTYPTLNTAQLNNVERFLAFVQMPGCDNPAKVYMDDLALIADAESAGSDIYTTDAPNAQLLAGQNYKLITGFENNKGITGAINAGGNDTRNYDTAGFLSGASSCSLSFFNGEAGGHQSLTITLENLSKRWAKAKYLQFYVENTDNLPLDLFFFKIISDDNTQMEVKADAKGIVFYDATSKIWSDLTVGTSAKYGVTAIKVPGKAKGLVRIPVTAEIFSGFDATKLETMNRIDLYAHIGGHAPGAKAYFDDFGLVGGALNVYPGDAPLGYTATPTQNVNLLEGQFYKELTGFEGTGIRSADIATSGNLQLNYSTEGFNSGAQSAKLIFKAGGENDIKIAGVTFDNQAVGSDWSQAKYVQLYVDNPMTTSLQLELLQYYVSGVAKPIKEGAIVDFYNTQTKSWYKLTTKKAYNPAYNCVEIEGGAKGLIRIPLNADTFTGFDANALGNVERFMIFAQMPGCVDPSQVTIDDLGVIAGAENVFPVEDVYSETNTVKLNPGELYRPITGFEPEDTVTYSTSPNTSVNWGISTDVHNNGAQSLYVKYTDGSAGGHKNFSLNTSGVSTNNWSKAKYLQFYVKNTCPPNSHPLQLFYIQVNNGNKMLGHGATGLKLYNMATKKWSDLPVVNNSDHYLGGTGGTTGVEKVYVPTIQIPAGFEGYVRIPLTDQNFTNCTLSEELPNITRLAMYSLVIGVPGPQSVYYDDFGLITYEGDTAPAYVDDATENPDPDPDDDDEIDLNDGADDEYLDIETTFDLSGTILDAQGNALAGAEVTLNSDSKTTTNSKGEYLFKGLKTDLHEISIIGADGTDYGFISFEVLTGAATRYKNTDIRIGHNATGLTINFKMDEYGITIDNVIEGSFTPETDNVPNPDPDEETPDTGSTSKELVIAVLLLSGAAGITFSRKRKVN